MIIREKEQYDNRIDLLRGASFLIVFIGHFSYENSKLQFLYNFAPFGVVLFFCLSGFLLGRVTLLEYRLTHRVNFRNFFLRRAFRILPLYFFFLLIILTISGVSQQRNSNYVISATEWSHLLTFSYNLLPDTYTTLSPLPAVTWSLSIEEQIYIFFPFIALLLARKKIVTLSIVLPTLMFGIFFVQINVFNSTTASRLTPLYLIPVIIGLVCAEFENIIRWKNSRISVIIIELTIGLVVILTIIFSHSQSNISYYLRVILMSCIFPLLLHLISFTRMWVALKAIAYLGRVSFGCYLYHWLVWNIFQSLDIGYSVGSGFTIFGWLLGLFVTLVLSVISYRFLEAPFLDIRRRYQAAPTS